MRAKDAKEFIEEKSWYSSEKNSEKKEKNSEKNSDCWMVVEYQYGRQEMAAFGNMRHDQKKFIFVSSLRI